MSKTAPTSRKKCSPPTSSSRRAHSGARARTSSRRELFAQMHSGTAFVDLSIVRATPRGPRVNHAEDPIYREAGWCILRDQYAGS
jgi:hypothetical protein